MTTFLIILALAVVAAGGVRMLLEKRPGYGAYYGLAKLTGPRLDSGPGRWPRLRRRRPPNDALPGPARHCPSGQRDTRPQRPAARPPALPEWGRRSGVSKPRVRQ